MTNSVASSDRWRRLHQVWVGGVTAVWAGLVGSLFALPRHETRIATGLVCGIAAFLPYLWLGLHIWHDSRRTGIGIPIAIMTFRLFASPILFSIVLWQFPDERRIIAWSGSIVVIVFGLIEALVFSKGVGRL